MNGVHVRLRVGSERYAVPIENVLEVAELGELSKLPGAGAAVLGVRNLRGHVLPVFDLARVLTVAGDATALRMLVAEHEGRKAALAVDEVIDVSELVGDDEHTEAELLSGAVLEDGHLVGVVDVEGLFASLAGNTA